MKKRKIDPKYITALHVRVTGRDVNRLVKEQNLKPVLITAESEKQRLEMWAEDYEKSIERKENIMKKTLIALHPLIRDICHEFDQMIDEDPEHEADLRLINKRVVKVITEEPTARAESHWFLDLTDSGAQIICKNCQKPIAPKYHYKTGQPYYELPDYCPHCGAFMYGDDNDDETEDEYDDIG